MKLFVFVYGMIAIVIASPVDKDLNKKVNDNLVFNPESILNKIDLKKLGKYMESLEKDNSFSNDIKKLFNNLYNSVNSISFVNEAKNEWIEFKAKFRKAYSNYKEEIKRFLIFFQNFILIKKHNIKYKAGEVKFSMAINHLTDLSDKEYSNLLGLKQSKRKKGLTYLPPLSDIELPPTVDWRSTAVTPVKDQGRCGSCWAFSATGSLEGQHFRKTKKLVSLSEQQLVDCSLKNGGCDGGLMDEAFDYIHENGGIDTESYYPYTSGITGRRQLACNYSVEYIGATVENFVDITRGNEKALQQAVALIGPVSVGIDASNFSFRAYKTGVYDEPSCDSNELDHGVLVVGYGVDSESGTPYWLVKNSWNTTWGDQGYIKMKRNARNMCGIATAASYPVV